MIGQFALMALVGVLGIRRMWRLPVGGARRIVAPLGLGLLVVGALIAVRGARDLGSNLTPMPHPRPEAQLVETGIYGRIRHPLYAAVVLSALGWAIATASAAALVAAAVLAVWLDTKARREEAWLIEQFPGYAAYRTRTRRFVPGVY